MELRDEGRGAVGVALPFALTFPGLLGVIETLFLSSRRADPRMSVSVAFVVGVAALLLLFTAATHRVTPRAGVAAAFGALVWALPVAVGDAGEIRRAMTEVEASGGGSDISGWVIAFTLVAIVAGTIMLSVAGAQRRLDAASWKTAWGAAALSAIVVALALTKSGRPDPDTYLDSLELRGTLDAGEVLHVGGRDLRYERVSRAPGREDAYADCRVSGLFNGPPFTDFVEGPDRPVGAADPCPSLRVLLDPRGDLAFVTPVDRPTWLFSPTIAFRVPDGLALRLSAPALADRIAAPIAWRIGAAGTLLLGLLLLCVAARLRRRAASLSGRVAHHEGGGSVVLGDGARVLLDFAAALTAIALTVVVIGVTPLVVARVYGI